MADPTSDFEERSTVNFKELDHAIAIFPSIFNSSSFKSNSINSSLGTGLSKTAMPFPVRHKLNNPSLPATAEENKMMFLQQLFALY